MSATACIVAFLVFCLVLVGAAMFIAPNEPPDQRWG
jgi:hypothetical protein